MKYPCHFFPLNNLYWMHFIFALSLGHLMLEGVYLNLTVTELGKRKPGTLVRLMPC